MNERKDVIQIEGDLEGKQLDDFLGYVRKIHPGREVTYKYNESIHGIEHRSTYLWDKDNVSNIYYLLMNKPEVMRNASTQEAISTLNDEDLHEFFQQLNTSVRIELGHLY